MSRRKIEWLHLWRNYEKIEEATAKTYLYTIIRTRCIDYLRKQNIHEEYVEFTSQLTDKMIEVDSQHSDSRVLRIRKAMEKLTPYNYGSVVILGGLSLVNSLHAYTFASLKRKKLISTTPLNDALNALILALNASAAAFVLLFTKKFRILS